MLGLYSVWLAVTGICCYRLQTLGAFATLETTKLFEYSKKTYHTDPGHLRLAQSYAEWAINVPPSDAYNYVRAGLGFADGHGLNIKTITIDEPNNNKYVPYYYQGPGTPVAIGVFIKLFGAKSVLPYYLLIAIVHLLTALLACVLASFYFEEALFVSGAGFLSLTCLPAVDTNLGAGFFWSEPLAAPFVVASLILVSTFWRQQPSYKLSVFTGFGFGSALAIASYFRDIYTTFVHFSLVFLIIAACSKRQRLKQILVFALASFVALSVIQQPWKKRNQFYFREYSMSGTTYCNSGLWSLTWDKNRDAIAACSGGIGLGNFLAPEKSAMVLERLQKDHKEGSAFAAKSLLEAVMKKPWDACNFKLRVYDTLWLGQTSCPYIYLWCAIGCASFIAFLMLTGFTFEPGLWLFPMFLLCISPIIQYEHRYAQPFFLFVSPITAMYLLKKFVYRNAGTLNLDKKNSNLLGI